MITHAAAKEKWPFLRLDDVFGAACLPRDGKVVPKEVALALAKGAQSRGAQVLENIGVLEVEHRNSRATGAELSPDDTPSRLGWPSLWPGRNRRHSLVVKPF